MHEIRINVNTKDGFHPPKVVIQKDGETLIDMPADEFVGWLGVAQKHQNECRDDGAQKEHLLGLLRDTKMRHGTCQPRSQKACTACNALDELDKIVKSWPGHTMVLSEDKRGDK